MWIVFQITLQFLQLVGGKVPPDRSFAQFGLDLYHLFVELVARPGIVGFLDSIIVPRRDPLFPKLVIVRNLLPQKGCDQERRNEGSHNAHLNQTGRRSIGATGVRFLLRFELALLEELFRFFVRLHGAVGFVEVFH